MDQFIRGEVVLDRPAQSGRKCEVEAAAHCPLAKAPSPFKGFNSSPEVIRLVVLMYMRFPLSLRNVENLLFEGGIDLCHETARFRGNRFGPLFAADIRRQRVSRMRGFRHGNWHLDEMHVRVNGEMVYAINSANFLIQRLNSQRHHVNAWRTSNSEKNCLCDLFRREQLIGGYHALAFRRGVWLHRRCYRSGFDQR